MIRMVILTVFCSFFLISISTASIHPLLAKNSKESYCQMTAEDFQYLGSFRGTLRAFSNPPGPFGTGLCWWYSRLQRSSLYLAIFPDPEGNKPTVKEAKKIIRSLVSNKKVVKIKGFSNWNQFSDYFEDEIIDILAGWQVTDTLLFEFVKALVGKSNVKSHKLHQIMDDLFYEVERKQRVVYQVMQLKGIAAHAWLVYAMEKNDRGYEIKVMDSNFGHRTFQYRYGDTKMNYFGTDFVPYTYHDKDYKKIVKAVKSYCGDTPLTL